MFFYFFLIGWGLNSLFMQAAGYPGVPGIFTPSQIEGWKKVTNAVHAKGGLILCQLWHVGRATTPGFLGGKTPLAPSDIPISGKALDGTEYADAPPRPMTVDDIKEVVLEYAAASKRAIDAGFDGVEIHGTVTTLLARSVIACPSRY
jgi:2,4-dienoyl-CoA reductase-like NADH-dependent reductase (Old Yellow Enzyme family)